MGKHIFLIGFCLALPFLTLTGYGQTNTLDSLRDRAVRQRAVRQRGADTTLYHYYFQAALFHNAGGAADSATIYLKKAFNLARRMNYNEGMADHFHFLSVVYSRGQQYDSAMASVREEGYWAQKSGHPLKLAYAYNDLGNMHIYYGNGDSAVISFLKALPLAENQGQDRLVSNISNNLSAAYNMIADYAASRQYAKKSFETAQRLNDSAYMLNSLLNLASMEAKLDNDDTALLLLNQAEVLAERTAAEVKKMDILNNMGEVLFKQGRYRASLSKYDEMLQIAAKYNDAVYYLYAYMNRGHTLAAVNRYADAQADLSRSMSLALQLKANFELSQIYLFSAELSEARNDYRQALNYWKAADSLKEMASVEKSRNDIRRLELQYKTAQKDKSIAQQKLELSERQVAIQRKDAVNTGLMAGCGLLAVISLLAYRDTKHRRRLFEQERELHARHVSELEKKHQLTAMQSVLKGQEQERSRLARDLHDGVGGLLSGVKLTLSAMKGNMFLPEKSVQSFGKVIEQLDRSIGELRRVSHNMMPEALIKYGLREALENYCENLDVAGKLNVRLQTYGLDQRMEQDTEIILYRIVQELLNNVIKHSGAKQVLVQLIREKKRFSLTVEDNGLGFDPEDTLRSAGAGIQNIRARAAYLNGTVDIRTAPGEGTSVTVEGVLQ